MCNIQKDYLSHKVPLDLIAFMGAAWLVGSSTRLIHYFPKTSKGGLFLSAGLAGTASYIYDCRFHDPDHHYLQTLLGKATAIALAVVCTKLSAKSLKGRAEISSLSAARFGLVAFVFAAIIAKATQEVSSANPPDETPLQKEHRHYLMDPRAWIRLEKEERTMRAKAFMEAGLPALCLEHAEIDTTDFLQLQTLQDWETLTPSQFSWACQTKPTFENYLLEEKKQLYTLFLSKGIDPILFDIHIDIFEFLEGKQTEINQLYEVYKNNPHLFYACPQNDQEELFAKLFIGKDPIPEVDTKLSAHQIATMDFSLFYLWGDYINEKDLWGAVPLATRTAFIKRTVLYIDFWDEKPFSEALYVGVDSNWIAEMTLKEIQTLNGEQLLIYHALMHAKDPQLSPEQLNAFKLGFQLYDIEPTPIPESDEEWERLSPEALQLIRNKVTFSKLSPRKKFNLYKCCLQKGIEPNRFAINGELMECFKTQPDAIDLLYQDFVQYPFYFYLHELDDQKAMMEELFAGRDPLPQVRATLSPDEINLMNINLLVLWGDYLTQEKRWAEVSQESRSAFIKIVVYSSRDLEFPKELYAAPIDCSSLTNVNPDEVTIMSERQLEVYYGVMEANWGNLDQVDTELFDAFNAAFTKLEWDTIQT